ncbi:hypothetical protein TNCV_175391 [Trichonephila clavipes]|nr:hypothetical protein TNCV_175391 [Trichonephila clavipes]
MPPDPRQRQITKFIAAKGYISAPFIALSIEHLADDSTIFLGSFPVLRENPWGGQGFHDRQSFTRGLAARRLFRVFPCREGNIYLQSLHAFSRIRT